jgi:tight adherence protein B
VSVPLPDVRVDAQILRWAAVSLLFVGVFGMTAIVVGDAEGVPRRYWARYVVFLERKLRRMWSWQSGQAIAIGQVVAVAILFALYVLVDLPLWYMMAGLVAIAPATWIERMRQRRVEAIEQQVDGFILALANALKATPSLGDALKSVQLLLRDPLRQEVELAVKEMRVGATLDQALLLMASRVGSRQLDSALSAVLIGRQVGGNLPKILETTALSLREMARLEGVVRTKTAEGKMQLWVLAIFPLLMIFGLSSVSPGYFDPLTESIVGYGLVVAAVLFWGSSLVVARKILAVDI